MRTFSINIGMKNHDYQSRVLAAIQRNRGYFFKYNKENAAEAEQLAFVIALEHQEDSFSSLDPYIKKLAKTVLRKKTKEIVSPLSDDDGEVHANFRKLVIMPEHQDDSELEEIRNEIVDMFLENEKEFLSLRDSVVGFKFESAKLKSEFIRDRMKYLIREYNNTLVYAMLIRFFSELDNTEDKGKASEDDILEVDIGEVSIRQAKDAFHDNAIISDSGERFGFDDTTLKTEGIALDYCNWDIDISGYKSIYKIDISPYIEYFYRQIMVPEGVNTDHIRWYGSRYCLTTPGGYRTLNPDRLSFLEDAIHRELILNIAMSNIGIIVGVTEDSVYIVPRKKMRYGTLRLRVNNRKSFDIPVEFWRDRKKGRRKVQTVAQVVNSF